MIRSIPTGDTVWNEREGWKLVIPTAAARRDGCRQAVQRGDCACHRRGGDEDSERSL